LHRPSWGRCVIQQIQGAADDQNEQAQTHNAGKSHEEDEDPLSYSCLASYRLFCISSCFSNYEYTMLSGSVEHCPFVQGKPVR
jgi:hypothetical protein